MLRPKNFLKGRNQLLCQGGIHSKRRGEQGLHRAFRPVTGRLSLNNLADALHQTLAQRPVKATKGTGHLADFRDDIGILLTACVHGADS